MKSRFLKNFITCYFGRKKIFCMTCTDTKPPFSTVVSIFWKIFRTRENILERSPPPSFCKIKFWGRKRFLRFGRQNLYPWFRSSTDHIFNCFSFTKTSNLYITKNICIICIIFHAFTNIKFWSNGRNRTGVNFHFICKFPHRIHNSFWYF